MEIQKSTSSRASLNLKIIIKFSTNSPTTQLFIIYRHGLLNKANFKLYIKLLNHCIVNHHHHFSTSSEYFQLTYKWINNKYLFLSSISSLKLGKSKKARTFLYIFGYIYIYIYEIHHYCVKKHWLCKVYILLI